jgi:SRSO17 transposase
MTYTSSKGHALIDRALYLPRSWTEDPDRRTDGGVPDDVEFATKPALATEMITRALDAGTPASWVAGDEVYGASPDLRTALQDRRIGYVLAIGCNRKVGTAHGRRRVDELAAALPRPAWQRLSAGDSAKGPRWYSWGGSRPPTLPLAVASVRFSSAATTQPVSWPTTTATAPAR